MNTALSRRHYVFGIIGLIGMLAYWYVRSQSPARNQPKLAKTEKVAEPSNQISEPEIPYLPPKVHDSRLAAIVDRNAKQRVTADISLKIQEAQKEDFPALHSVLADTQDSDTVRNEVANLLARSNDPGLADALIKVLENPAEQARFRSFATQHLGRQLESNEQSVKDRVTSRLRKALDDRHISVRREALLALVRARDAVGIETTERWFSSPVRGELEDECLDLAIRLIYDLDRRQQIPSIRRYTRDGNETVRIAAIVALSQWGDEESRPAFEEAAKSKVVRLQRAGNAALKRLDQAKQTAATQAPKTVSPAP